jgi:endonuclease/exonuclease/phosphatase (EEP) superfamily protein YafD
MPASHPPLAASTAPTAPRRRVSVLRLLWLAGLPAWWFALAPWLPTRHWLVDLPASFAVQAMFGLGLLALLLCLLRRPRAALPHLLFALVATAAVLPPRWAAHRAHTPLGTPITLLSLNLLYQQESAAAALALATAHDPDVLFCCELTPKWRAQLAPLLDRYPHRCEAPAPGSFGVGLFSRLPLRDAAVVPLAFTWAPAVRAVVETPSGPFGLLAVHTPPPGPGHHCAERDAALAAAPAILANLPRPWCVVGDCNATPYCRAFGELLDTTGLVDAGGAHFGGTWTAHWPWFLRVAIDHVLVDPAHGLGTARTEVGPEFGSDHLPLFAELRLATAPLASPAGGGAPK